MRALSLLVIALVAFTVFGCEAGTKEIAPASPEETTLLKKRMNEAFAALEMYSVDNGSRYPADLSVLIPKYLDEIPIDPVSRTPISFERTSDGFLLGAKGDYGAVKAEPGYPKMNQDGFFVLKASDFPVYE